ncbi:hypothetical protein [Herbidospora sp. NBRC 101105]|uniref:hypothetical protein n=1 Tax=Herbidospora sp. NBRC 101105 TaxID=3032195 RepID=UPI0024A40857|nr:hypothetical protein [Herbidospora sp. NBRC 101105]GLX96638.1 hypothetical protein Hesp01_45880 [Herbidospora sp. NBRC 101105]
MAGTHLEGKVRMPKFSRAYSFALVTGAFFLISWIGQFIFQAVAFAGEQSDHGRDFAWADHLPQFMASTRSSCSSYGRPRGLAVLYYWGSSQSRESDERIEAKLDALLRERGIDPADPR